MTNHPKSYLQSKPQPDYGLDAPAGIVYLFRTGAVIFAVSAVLYLLGLASPLNVPVGGMGLVVSSYYFVSALIRLWYSKIGKLRERDLLLALIPWRGDETVLDVGCGAGLLLIGAARRLSTGKAIGIDIWQDEDLSNNRPETTWENARRVGVAERIEVRDGDARQLAFADASFDVIVSSLALHNIADAAQREQAVRELARVLKPGGHVALLDIMYTRDYVKLLRESGLSNVKRVPMSRLFFLWSAVTTLGQVQYYRVVGKKGD